MPTAQEVHTDEVLRNVSIAFMQDTEAFVSMDVSPSVDVGDQSDKYRTYGRGDFFTTNAQEHADGDEAPVIDYSLSDDTYYSKVYSVKDKIGPQERANADEVLDLEMEATENVTRDLMIKKEKDFLDTYFTTGTWSTDLDGTTADFDQFDDDSGSPIDGITAQIDAVEAQTGFRPNGMLFGPDAFRGLKNNDNVIDRIKYTESATQSTMGNALSNLLDLDEIRVARAVENTANEGASDSLDYIGNQKDALLYYTPSSPGLRTPSAMYSFRWSGLSPQMVDGVRIRQYEDQDTEADFIEGKMTWDHKVISSELGVYFENASS